MSVPFIYLNSNKGLREEFVELGCSFRQRKGDRQLKTVPLKLLVAGNEVLLKTSASTQFFIDDLCLFILVLRISKLRTFQRHNKTV